MSTTQDIITAINNLDLFLKVPALQGATARYNKNGKPFFFTGGFTMVFQLTSGTQKWAFRVWHVPVKDMKERFREISAYLTNKKLPYFADFIFDEKGLIVGGTAQDTIRMEWVEGNLFKDYIAANLNSGVTLKKLAEKFLKMCSDLRDHQISHGDLQHGNMLVNLLGEIKLVDYDSVCIPSLEGQYEMVAGLKGYQHPSRLKGNKASLKADYFSELIIYLSLLAIIEKKSLWHDYHVKDSAYMLFNETDLEDLERSKIYTDLKGLTPEIDGLLYILEIYLKESSFLNLKSFNSYQVAPEVTLFKGDRAAIICGMTITLNWKTTGAQVVEIDNGVGKVNTKGTIDVLPVADTMYRLTAKGHFGERSELFRVMVFPTPVITDIPVSIPEFSSRIEFDKLQFKPPTIDVSINIFGLNDRKPTFARPVDFLDTLKTSWLSRQAVFSISHMYELIKRKIIS